MGPATVGFPQPLWGWIMPNLHMLRRMDGYVEVAMKFRSIFVSIRDNRGARKDDISSSGVNRALNNLLRFVPYKGRLSATKLRKAIFTGAIGQRRTGQTHGQHQSQTADRYYHLQRQSDLAFPMSRLIKFTMTWPIAKKLPALETPPPSGRR